MRMFSAVRTDFVCPRCGQAQSGEVQFEYGNLYSHRYKVGDRLVWGRPQVDSVSVSDGDIHYPSEGYLAKQNAD